MDTEFVHFLMPNGTLAIGDLLYISSVSYLFRATSNNCSSGKMLFR